MQVGKPEIAKIRQLKVREAFPHEAHAFTTWLEENIDALSDRLGFKLTVIEREKQAGDFSADLLCRDERDALVIVENQLEKSDHDHLGKLLTYLVNLEAKTAIWVTPEPRHEHEKVIDWLNENTPEDTAFFLVRVEAIRIGDSPLAPLFTVLAQPDSEVKKIGAAKKGLAEEFVERHELRLRFWGTLLQKSIGMTKLGQGKKPTKDHWFTISSGTSGISFTYQIYKDGAGIEIYIDRGSQAENKRIFDALYAQQESIEQQLGAALDWRRLDAKRASRVLWLTKTGDLWHEETWNAVQDELIPMMIKFYSVFRPYFGQLV